MSSLCSLLVGALAVPALIAPAFAGDDCAVPTVIAGFGPFPYTNAGASSSGFDGGSPALCDLTGPGTIGPAQDLFHVWVAPCTGTFRIQNCDSAPVGTAISVHEGTDCSATCISSSVLQTPLCGTPGAAELSFLATRNTTYLIQIGGANAVPGANDFDWTIEPISTDCPELSLSVFCNPSQTHTQGGNATMIESVGTGLGAGVRLECTNGPVGEFGIFLVGQNLTSGSPLFDGVLCLGIPLARYDANAGMNLDPAMNSLGVFDATGRFQTLVGNSAAGSGFDVPRVVPMLPVNPTIAVGETWYFQCWFRDQPAGMNANMSDVLEVQF